MRQLFRWGNLIFFAAMIIVNLLANSIPINGNTTGDVSLKYNNLFTPAPYTFSIWGVIYLFMGFFAIYNAIMSPENGNVASMRSDIGPLFIVSCMFNIAWIFTWHYEKLGWSVLCIIGLLLTLIIINIRFMIQPQITLPVRLSVYGFNIYVGWICAATIANISVYLTKENWNGFGISPQIWTIIILFAVGAIGLAFVFIGNRFMATLAILWAVIGIFVKHISKSGYGNEFPTITVVLGCIAILLFLSIVAYLVRVCWCVTDLYPTDMRDDD